MSLLGTTSNACLLCCAGQVLTRAPPAQTSTAGEGRKYHIHTFGCQMNLADSERMAGTLESAGYSCADDISDADVIVYNTCSIRDKAEQKVYSALGKQVRAPLAAWVVQGAHRGLTAYKRLDSLSIPATAP